MRIATISIPVKEYSIIEFPFIIKDIQFNAFTYKKMIQKKVPVKKNIAIKNSGVKKITLSKKTKAKKLPTKGAKNLLGMTKGKNVITFKPKFKGYLEMIIWGHKDFPIILKIKVVDKKYGSQNIKFVNLTENRHAVIEFESSSHEKIIEKIVKHLYNKGLNPKPSGYANVIRKEVYDVAVMVGNKKIATLRNTLIREIVGRGYVGQVWNVNVLKNKEEIPKDFKIHLYEDMFLSDGVYAVSLETYDINIAHGTRVMIVRAR